MMNLNTLLVQVLITPSIVGGLLCKWSSPGENIVLNQRMYFSAVQNLASRPA